MRVANVQWSISLCAVFLCAIVIAAEPNDRGAKIETVKVTGERLALTEAQQAIAEIPGGATLVDMDAVGDRNVSSLADALRYVPGVFSNSTNGSDGIFLSSRGSNLDATDYDMNGIKLLQDGLPITTADGNNHNRLIDPLSARYATVARGANALTFGASTLGGAIGFVSPTARDSEPELLVNGGSFGQLLGRATVSGEIGDALDGLMTVEAKEWDGYRDHNKQTRYGAYGNTGWRVTDALSTRLYGTYIKNEQELAGSLSEAQVQQDPDQANPAAIGGNYQLNVDAWRLASTTTWQIDADRSFFIGVSFEEQKLFHPIVDKIMVDFDGPGGPLPEVEVISLLIDTHHRDIGGALRYEQRVGPHDLLFGLNYGDDSVDGHHFRNDGGKRNGVTEEIDNSASSVEGFAMDRWQFQDRWTLIAGAQFVVADRQAKTVDIASGTISNPNDDFSTVNPRVGLIYAIGDDASIYANVSRLYEPPTNFELADDVNGNNHVLDAMHGTVVEIGTRGRGDLSARTSWGWEIDVYQAWIQDEILSVDDPNAPGTSLSTNVDQTIHAGVEALVDFRFTLDDAGTHAIAPLLSVSLNDFSFENDDVYGNNQLPAAPDYVVRGEILYRHASGFFAGPTFDLVGKRYADFVNSYTVDSYNLLGLRAGWDRNTWRVYAEFRNVLDAHYIATTGVRDVAAPDAEILNPGEPRAAFIGVQARL